ncbi:MAG: glycosyltransferase, partial [Gammaproteobacteria bacterium]|nr:glycosyltransferase [Gammaproteobacteria bacterium]
MNIAMMTNTYSPHVGGVARSIEAFTSEYWQRGHHVLVVAPMFENVSENEQDIIRIPAIQHFNGSDFSVALPVPGLLSSAIQEFEPDVIHSHHPFLIGSTALRIAHTHEIPLVFTHHTKYEEYTHYMPGDSQALKRFVISLSTNYANLCDLIFAPSESIAEMIRERGVETPIAVVPTGVNLSRFENANGLQFRKMLG